MTSAFKCNRCGKFSEAIASKASYDVDGDLATLIYPTSIRFRLDLCGTCNSILLQIIYQWWHGLS